MQAAEVFSLHASGVDPDRLRSITADYLALDRARVHRRLVVARSALPAALVTVAGAGVHWLTTAVWLIALGVILVPPAVAFFVEYRCDRRLAGHLAGVPYKKVIKNP